LTYPHSPAPRHPLSPHHRRAATVALTVAAAVTLALGAAGCSDSDTGPSPAKPPSQSAPTITPNSPITPAPGGAGAIGDAAPPVLDDNGPTDAGDAGRPDQTSAEQARTRAVAFLRAFARTDLPQQQWWAGISGFFSPTAAAAYTGTDVANVPVHHVDEDSAKVLPDSTRYRAQIAVTTDDGTYTVTLIRAGDWLVDRATPPRPHS
jgi:hypothetical protein